MAMDNGCGKMYSKTAPEMPGSSNILRISLTCIAFIPRSVLASGMRPQFVEVSGIASFLDQADPLFDKAFKDAKEPSQIRNHCHIDVSKPTLA